MADHRIPTIGDLWHERRRSRQAHTVRVDDTPPRRPIRSRVRLRLWHRGYVPVEHTAGWDGDAPAVFRFMVPVHVHVEDGAVTQVVVMDDDLGDPVEGEVGGGEFRPLSPAELGAYRRLDVDGLEWPRWQFGY